PIRKVVGRVGCITPKQAAQERADIEKQIREGTFVPASMRSLLAPTQDSSVTTCKDLWLAYKADCETRDVRRIDRLKLAWSHLEPSFGAKPAATVRPKDIAQYIRERKASGMAAATCNREVAVLKAATRHGARLEMVERIPMFPKKLKEAKPREGFIEETQYKTLTANSGELWLRTFLALGFTYGCRKSEMLNLRVH